MVSELRKYQIRIPREILGRNSGLTFVLAQRLKNRFFGHVTFLGGVQVYLGKIYFYNLRVVNARVMSHYRRSTSNNSDII